MDVKNANDRDFIVSHATKYAERWADRYELPRECCLEYGVWYLDYVIALDEPCDYWPGHDVTFPQWLETAPVRMG